MKDIVLVHHKHDAKKAGLHYDWRIIIDGKAPSWATRKEQPLPGGKLILWQQPVHSKEYAETEEMITPDGSYGAGKTTTTYRVKGKMKSSKDQHHLYMDDGQQFFIKKMPTYSDKAWLLVNVTPKEKDMDKEAEQRKRKLKNKPKPKPKKKRINPNDYPEIGYIRAIEEQKGKLRLQRRYLPGITRDVLFSRAQQKVTEKTKKKEKR